MADLAQRLDVTGDASSCWPGPATGATRTCARSRRRSPGRFDHYICRRDDNLRDREPDEVPRIHRAALQASASRRAQISIIPDEQEAIDAALNMGQPGDLLLVFADALVRSWKQITKLRASRVCSATSVASASAPEVED